MCSRRARCAGDSCRSWPAWRTIQVFDRSSLVGACSPTRLHLIRRVQGRARMWLYRFHIGRAGWRLVRGRSLRPALWRALENAAPWRVTQLAIDCLAALPICFCMPVPFPTAHQIPVFFQVLLGCSFHSVHLSLRLSIIGVYQIDTECLVTNCYNAERRYGSARHTLLLSVCCADHPRTISTGSRGSLTMRSPVPSHVAHSMPGRMPPLPPQSGQWGG